MLSQVSALGVVRRHQEVLVGFQEDDSNIPDAQDRSGPWAGSGPRLWITRQWNPQNSEQFWAVRGDVSQCYLAEGTWELNSANQPKLQVQSPS